MDLWRCGRILASTWFGLRHARLKAVVIQPTVVSSFGSFVLRSSFSSASFSKLPPLLRFFFREQRVAIDTRTAERNFNSCGVGRGLKTRAGDAGLFGRVRGGRGVLGASSSEKFEM